MHSFEFEKKNNDPPMRTININSVFYGFQISEDRNLDICRL